MHDKTIETNKDSKYNYFVCIEEHEKLYREKELYKKEYLKLKKDALSMEK